MRWIVFLFTGLGGVLSATAETPKPSYVLDTKPTAKVSGALGYSVTCPMMTAATGWVFVIPVLPELPSQGAVKTSTVPVGSLTREKSREARQVLTLQFPAKGGSQSGDVRAVYEATLYSRHLRVLNPGETAPKVPPLSAADRILYTSPLLNLDFKSAEFQKWLIDKNLVLQKGSTSVDYARSVFELIRAQYQYEYLPKMDRRASEVCRMGKTDCGGMSHLFVSALRSQAIPARCLYGRWAESAKPDDKLGAVPYFQWHVIAEFYADGVGWIPVDCSSAVLWEKPDAPSKNFGQQMGNFLTQHIDPDLEIDSVHFGISTVQNNQTPRWWVTGKGKVDGNTHVESWTVSKQ